jgi:hypothetical protein
MPHSQQSIGRFTIDEVAARWGMHPVQVRVLVERGELPAERDHTGCWIITRLVMVRFEQRRRCRWECS